MEPLRPRKALIGLPSQDERIPGAQGCRTRWAYRGRGVHVYHRYLDAAGEPVRAVVLELERLGVVVRGRVCEVGGELEAAVVVQRAARYVKPDLGLAEGVVQAWVHVGLVDRVGVVERVAGQRACWKGQSQ